MMMILLMKYIQVKGYLHHNTCIHTKVNILCTGRYIPVKQDVKSNSGSQSFHT